MCLSLHFHLYFMYMKLLDVFLTGGKVVVNNCATFIFNSVILLKIVTTPGCPQNANLPCNDLDFLFLWGTTMSMSGKGNYKFFMTLILWILDFGQYAKISVRLFIPPYLWLHNFPVDLIHVRIQNSFSIFFFFLNESLFCALWKKSLKSSLIDWSSEYLRFIVS